MADTNFKYFSSSDVKIYPTARRGTFTIGEDDKKTFTYDPEARLNTEYNTTNGFSKTAEKQSYIVEYVTDGNVLKCVVGGYYFEIKNFNNYLINKPQYLIIRTTTVNLINTTTDARTTQLLVSLEDNSTETNVLDNTKYEFTGLAYTNKVNIATNYTYLKLFIDDACTQLNQEAYLDTSLVKTGTGKHSIVGTFGFENSSEILSPNNIPDTNINTGSGDYSITFGNGNKNNGTYSLVYGNKIVNNGANNIVITTNSAEKTITGNNNILIGENIVATGNQLILNKIEEVKIYNDVENILDYSAETGFKLGENLVTISQTGGLVLKTNDTSNINLIKVDAGNYKPLTLTLDGNKKAQLIINGDISADNMKLSSGTLSGVAQITMANGGIINNSNGNIYSSCISVAQYSHLGIADASALTVTGNAKVNGAVSSNSVVTNTATVSGVNTVGSLKINQAATGISFGNNAQIRYDATNKRLEIIC